MFEHNTTADINSWLVNTRTIHRDTHFFYVFNETKDSIGNIRLIWINLLSSFSTKILGEIPIWADTLKYRNVYNPKGGDFVTDSS